MRVIQVLAPYAGARKKPFQAGYATQPRVQSLLQTIVSTPIRLPT
jgi:hypothetical protein